MLHQTYVLCVLSAGNFNYTSPLALFKRPHILRLAFEFSCDLFKVIKTSSNALSGAVGAAICGVDALLWRWVLLCETTSGQDEVYWFHRPRHCSYSQLCHPAHSAHSAAGADRVIPLYSPTHLSVTARVTIPLHCLGIQPPWNKYGQLNQLEIDFPSLFLTSDFVAGSRERCSLRLTERKAGLWRTKQWV